MIEENDADSWYKVNKKGEIPYPSKTDRLVGDHAITIVGYDSKESTIKFANDWGINWGQNGFGRMNIDVARKIMVSSLMFAIDVPLKSLWT